MIVYEHAMIGIDGALALGLERRQGWQIVALAGIAAVLPDVDGLTILFGIQCYSDGHRVWAHNLLVAAMTAAIVSVVMCRTDILTQGRDWLGKRVAAFSDRDSAPVQASRGWATLGLWLTVGIAAAYSHLLADMAASIGRDMPVWGVPLLWPFSDRAFAMPLIRWGDVGPTLILAAGMFAMLRWQKRTQSIAIGALAATAAYLLIRGLCG
jgi:membrane-bound metal-dependent hydrolase YbcI (DUF457 family)